MTPIEALGTPFSWLAWAVLFGFMSHRLWRMVALDAIFDKPRERLPQTGFVRELIDCPWCLGFWFNGVFAMILLADGTISLVGAIAVWLAGSTVTGVVGRGD